MTISRTLPRRAALCASISMLSLVFAAGAAMAQSADTRSVDLQGDRSLPISAPAAVGSKAPAGSAPALSPAQASLDSIQPASIISDKILRDVIQPTSDYNEAVKFVPGWVSNNANGLLGDAKGGWRGFQDGQYNITFDGIPFGDMNDPTHHSAAYFPGPFIGQVVADRGPGAASQAGYATFGGTLGLQSVAFTDAFSGYVQGSSGSFNTLSDAILVQTGKIAGTEARALFQYYNANTAGDYMQGKYNQNQILAKAEDKLGDFTVTVFTTFGTENYNNVAAPTYAQWQTYGKRYGQVNSNPQTQQYVGYNNSQKQTDMEYVDLDGTLAGWHVDNKLYTYAYTYPSLQNNGGDQTIEGLQSNSNNALSYKNGVLNATYKNAAGVKQYVPITGVASTDVIGYLKNNNYRAFGDVFSVDRYIDAGIASGKIRAGFWWEHGDNTRLQEWYDYTKGATLQSLGNSLQGSYKLELSSHITTIQPFVEYLWTPLPGLTVTPGFKWELFNRDHDATVNQTTLVPIIYSHTYYSSQPYLSANYKVTEEISVYAQASKGFLVPSVSAYYVWNPTQSSYQPQTTSNYQAGVVFKNESVAADVDVYRIIASNFGQTTNLTNGSQVYSDNGTAQYQGVEAEATYAFGNGLSVYGSGALIGAKYIAGPNKDMRVGDAPTYTAAIGTIWDNGKFFGSLMQKFVGDLYGSGNQTASTSTVNGQLNHIPGYNTTDLVFGIRGSAFSEKAYMRNVEIKAGILNAFDHRNITEIAGTPSTLTAAQSGNALTYAFLPGQMSFVSVKVGF